MINTKNSNPLVRIQSTSSFYTDSALKRTDSSQFIQKLSKISNSSETIAFNSANVQSSELNQKLRGNSGLPGEIERKNDAIFSMGEVIHFAGKMIDSATLALKKIELSDSKLKEKTEQKINDLKERNTGLYKYEFLTECVDKKDIGKLINLKAELIHIITKNISGSKNITMNKARTEAVSLFKDSLNSLNNDQKWLKIIKDFEHNGKIFTSNLTPAGQFKLGNQDIFPVNYNDKGISSATTACTEHATNLWLSDFTVSQDGSEKSIFKGLRHGILSPYSLPYGSSERAAGAINRAKEVITSALFMDPEKLDAALNGKIVDVKLTSLSLVTPFKIPGEAASEKNMLSDQIAAWKTLSEAENVELQINDQNGQLKNIKAKVDVAAFNFGVNNLAVGWLKAGKKQSEIYNNQAINKLIGVSEKKNNGDTGGWVGHYLDNGPHENDMQVRILTDDIKIMLAHSEEGHSKEDPYRLARKIALLTYEIGLTPAWNCKSGKDRTGILDAEIKMEIASNEFHKAARYSSHLPVKNDNELFAKIMLYSGNREVQKMNTGIEGNKVLKKNTLVDLIIGRTGIRERIGNVHVTKAAKGGAKIA